MSDTVAPDRWDPAFALDLASAGAVDELNRFVAVHLAQGCRLRVDIADDEDWWVPQWEVLGPRESRVIIGRRLRGQRSDRLHWRIFNIMPLIAAYHQYHEPVAGRVGVNMEDFGHRPGLAFCENRPGYFLIPDPEFVSQQGYGRLRQAFAKSAVAWHHRVPKVFWRGSDFGPRVSAWHELPRVRLCQLAMAHPAVFDVGMNKIRHGTYRDEIIAAGLIRDHVPAHAFNCYRAHIDIDGRTNSWSGLFIKLLSGSPVLKVESPAGYRQWYDDDLEPWVNFVPVAADMSDLVEKAAWVLQHDEAAREIGERGRALALSLSYENELTRAGGAISAALRYFG